MRGREWPQLAETYRTREANGYIMNDSALGSLAKTVRNAFELYDETEIRAALNQIETAFSRALLYVSLDEAPSLAKQRKILEKLTPEDFRSGAAIDDAVRVRVGMFMPAGIFDLFTKNELPDDRLLQQAIADARFSLDPAPRGRPAGTASLAARQLARELGRIWHEWTNRLPARSVFVGKDAQYSEGGPFHRFIADVLAVAPDGLRKTRKGVLSKVDSFVRLAKAELEVAYLSDSETEDRGLLAEEDWLGQKAPR
jgi:hypothetical protein